MKYAPVDFDNGTGMDRTMDKEFDEWSRGVHQDPGECDEVRRYVDVQKDQKEVGLWGEWRAMEGNG